MTFPENLTFLRKEKGLKQTEIAEILGISLHAYQRFEYGEQEPRMSILIALADLYRISLDELVCREPQDR